MKKVTTPAEARESNIIDMALGFTSTLRVFEGGSKALIAEMLLKYFQRVSRVGQKGEFNDLHDEFCKEFMSKVKVAGKKLKNKGVLPPRAPSFGHAAKMFDVCAKVWFHYCSMPSLEQAKITIPLLNSAIDTPILNYLKGKYPQSKIAASSISDIDQACYNELQRLAALDRASSGAGAKNMLEYDDIVWLELNRK